MKFLRWFNYRVYKVLKASVVSLFILLLAFSAVQVILRLVFKTGIPHAESLSRYLVLWVSFLGASLATFKHRHINLDIFSKHLKKINPGLVTVIISTAATVILGFISWAGVVFILNEMPDSQKVYFIPVWVMESVIPLTFIVMMFIYFQRIFDGIRMMRAAGRK
ncbi:MAG TPA: TRAP transporter small permease subunit [Candidatus Goldiibacteriota bacterium]|nr:TRAP transporter small permease subunit [Candidatus Goldiibacteriota bacterium]HPI03716.1 TRAP transporter small permease subunit [Candidatus Goldiibacteriota bacterium]HRQ44264.1 TRAP transporter small permease subunit [Candidatus Goldiibacteriota bacterium]